METGPGHHLLETAARKRRVLLLTVTSFAVSVFVFLFLNKMFKYFLYMQ